MTRNETNDNTAREQLAVTSQETLRTEYGVYLTAKCGKTTATVGITEDRVQVVCHNVAHRVWRGAGRHFESVAAAISGYKSAEMHAIIRAADKLNS